MQELMCLWQNIDAGGVCYTNLSKKRNLFEEIVNEIDANQECHNGISNY